MGTSFNAYLIFKGEREFLRSYDAGRVHHINPNIGDDAPLKAWFDSLEALPANRRYSELGRLAAQLHAAGEDKLASLLKSLNEESLYSMVKDVTEAFKD